MEKYVIQTATATATATTTVPLPRCLALSSSLILVATSELVEALEVSALENRREARAV